MMRDSESLGLKGLVQRIITTRETKEGRYTEEREFDRTGRSLRMSAREPGGEERRFDFSYTADGEQIIPGRRSAQNADGSRVETHDVSRTGTWSMERLHAVGFGTRGASTVRTRFDREGVPIESIFEGEGNEVFSRIRYVCDDKGRVLEAIQCAGSSLPPPESEWVERVKTSGVEPAQSFMDPGMEQFRAEFRYDSEARIVEQKTYFAQQPLHRTQTTYNSYGDVSTLISDDQPSVRFDYEYDSRHNWILRYVTDSLGRTEYHRKITYYDET